MSILSDTVQLSSKPDTLNSNPHLPLSRPSCYKFNMKRFLKVLLFALLVSAPSSAETLGEALQSVERGSEAVASRQQADTWGVQTAVDDLRRLVAQSQRLSAALSSPDARDVKELEDGLVSAVRGVRTSMVMLSEADQAELGPVLDKADLVNQRLTDMRLRFGGKANTISGDLSGLSLEPSESELPYSNIQELLIDVRWTRDLVSALMPARFPQPGGIGFNQHNNLDPLQVRRVELAIWNLERTLSTNLDDVRQSVPAWERFKREYDRLNYMGAGRQVRMLEQRVERLERFYSDPAL